VNLTTRRRLTAATAGLLLALTGPGGFGCC
jgi:hypothetical protein